MVASRRVGGFRTAFNGAHEADLLFRLTDQAAGEIVHLPLVLVHRSVRNPINEPDRNRWAQALDHYLHLGKGGFRGEVDRSPTGPKVRFAVPLSAKVSIIIPTAGKEARVHRRPVCFIRQCLASICQKTTYGNVEIVVVDNGNLAPEVEAVLAAHRVRRITLLRPFNFAANLNAAARRAEGDYLLFLNDDTEVISPDWIERMLEYAALPNVGAVGAKLYFPDARLQHVGVILTSEGPCHPYYGLPATFAGYQDCCRSPRNYLAVTGACLMTRRKVFEDLGGFDEQFSLNYNDVDYCLRLWDRGYRVVFTPEAELFHYESMGRDGRCTVRQWEVECFRQRWGEKYRRDPFDNLSAARGTWRIGELLEENNVSIEERPPSPVLVSGSDFTPAA